MTINQTTGIISGTVAQSAVNSSPFAITVTVTNGNHAATSTFTWNIGVSRITIYSPGSQSNYDGDVVDLSVPATDVFDSPLTFTAAGLPTGLNIDRATGEISGTVGAQASSQSPFTVTITAAVGAYAATATFTWSIATTIADLGNQSNFEGSGIFVPIRVLGVYDSNSLTYAATGLPNGLAIDSQSGVISGIVAPQASTASPYSVTITATENGVYSASVNFSWYIYSPVSIANPGNQSNFEGDNVDLPISASEVFNQPLTYSASGLPHGLSLDPVSGAISGTIAPEASSGSPYAVTITVNDGPYQAATKFTWAVASAITVPSPGPQEDAEGDAVLLSVLAHDDFYGTR